MRTLDLSRCLWRAASAVGFTARLLRIRLRGLYNWIHSTGDAERSFFYREVFGIELARSPFAGAYPPTRGPSRSVRYRKPVLTRWSGP